MSTKENSAESSESGKACAKGELVSGAEFAAEREACGVSDGVAGLELSLADSDEAICAAAPDDPERSASAVARTARSTSGVPGADSRGVSKAQADAVAEAVASGGDASGDGSGVLAAEECCCCSASGATSDAIDGTERIGGGGGCGARREFAAVVAASRCA